MDIPKQPISSSSSKVSASESIAPVNLANTNTTTASTASVQRVPLSSLPSILTNAVPLEALALPVGEQVVAKVIGELRDKALILGRDADLPNKDQTPRQLPTITEALKTPDQFQSISNETTKQSSLKNWVLQIGNQYLVTQTNLPLVLGKLLAVTLNENARLSISNPSITPDVQTTKSIEHLLRQVITRAMPQQTSLSSGFSTLTATSEMRAGTAAPDSSSAQILAKLITLLTKERIPNSDSLARLYQSLASTTLGNITQGSSPTQGNNLQSTVENWLKNSGVTFEAGQLTNTNKSSTALKVLETQTAQVSTIWKALSAAGQAGSKGSETLLRAADVALNFITAQQAGALNSGDKMGELLQRLSSAKAPSQVTETVQGYQRALQAASRSAELIIKAFRSIENAPAILSNERMQQSLEQALTNYNTYSQKAVSSLSQFASQLSTYNPQNLQNSGVSSRINTQAIFETALQQLPLTQPVTSDLKALLQNVAAGLRSTISEATSASSAGDPKLDLRGSLETTLLNRPFDFPQFDKGILKAQAIMTDQELTTGQLLKLIAGMLNRIQFNQANSLLQAQANADTAATQSWNMELPYLHEQQIQTLQLRIDQHQAKQKKSNSNEKEQRRSWTIELSFDFEGIGPLHIKAELTPPNLKTEVWVADCEAKDLITQEQALFVKRLQEAGLEVEEPTCRIGTPERRHRAHIKQGLVDIHA